MTITDKNIVGELVAQDYRTATVFKQNNIDFCCKGNRTIEEVCASSAIDPAPLIEALNEISFSTEGSNYDFQSWDLDLLVDYIEKKHHRYVEKRIPEIKSYLTKVTRVHGQRHPELIEIDELFTASSFDLINHMHKEETILFPFIRQMKMELNLNRPPFGSVKNPVRMMMKEHAVEGERYKQIEQLSNNYTPPADACTTYSVAFSMLKEFEDDLHMHIHIENNILFPRVLKEEAKLNLI